MRIEVAGEPRDIEKGATILDLIKLEGVETPEYVTVSVNGDFIPKDELEKELSEGDSVEFLYFMGGGM
ncbi:MAG: sulfur carrier protein ThiS [Clostridiales bacterium]|jgi:sulfur carrier protein|nr:sulfur carrier protein ThiS [Clostridiales bacterium]